VTTDCSLYHPAYECPSPNPSQAGHYSIYLPRKKQKAEMPMTLTLVIYRDGLPVRRQSPNPFYTMSQKTSRTFSTVTWRKSTTF